MLTLILKDESIYSITKNNYIELNNDVIVFTIDEPTNSTSIVKRKTVMLDLTVVSSVQLDEHAATSITDTTSLKSIITEYFSK